MNFSRFIDTYLLEELASPTVVFSERARNPRPLQGRGSSLRGMNDVRSVVIQIVNRLMNDAFCNIIIEPPAANTEMIVGFER